MKLRRLLLAIVIVLFSVSTLSSVQAKTQEQYYNDILKEQKANMSSIKTINKALKEVNALLDSETISEEGILKQRTAILTKYKVSDQVKKIQKTTMFSRDALINEYVMYVTIYQNSFPVVAHGTSRNKLKIMTKYYNDVQKTGTSYINTYTN